MMTPHRRKHRQLERWLLFGVLLVGGCSHWHTERVPVGTLLTSKTPSRIRVTRADGLRFVVRHPRVVGDTIVEARSKHLPATRVPLSDVTQVAVRTWDPLRTTALVLGTTIVAGYAAIAAVWHFPD